MKISVAIITKDAAVDLDRCLASVAFADEIVVLDQNSGDETAAVCARHGAALSQSEFLGFGPTKQKAVDLCRNQWVLSIDSDEECTPELRAAIESLPAESGAAAYTVNRLSCFLGRWIHHCGWHPEHVVRLFDRRRAAFNTKPVHEAIETDGEIRRLPGLMKHYAYDNMEQYLGKLNRYTTLAAEQMHAAGRTTSLLQAVVRSKATFWQMYIARGGILDGGAGLVLCCSSSFSVLAKYVKLWRMGRG